MIAVIAFFFILGVLVMLAMNKARDAAIELLANRCLSDIYLLRQSGIITHIQATVYLNDLNDLTDVRSIVAVRRELDDKIEEARRDAERQFKSEVR